MEPVKSDDTTGHSVDNNNVNSSPYYSNPDEDISDLQLHPSETSQSVFVDSYEVFKIVIEVNIIF